MNRRTLIETRAGTDELSASNFRYRLGDGRNVLPLRILEFFNRLGQAARAQ